MDKQTNKQKTKQNKQITISPAKESPQKIQNKNQGFLKQCCAEKELPEVAPSFISHGVTEQQLQKPCGVGINTDRLTQK